MLVGRKLILGVFVQSSLSSEVETKLGFELTSLVALLLNIAEGVGAVDVQNRIVRYGMVENIRGIHPKLEAFGFGDFDSLAYRRIEVPLSGQLHGLLPECASRSRLRVLKNNLAGLCIANRLQRAVVL